MKCENDEKESWVDNCENKMSFVLQIRPKMFNPNTDFGLHYNPIPFQT